MTTKKNWHTFKLVTALTAIGALFSVQLLSTFMNKNYWPFCSYNLFHYQSPQRVQEIRVRLFDDRGNSTPILDTWGLLPLEYFRVISILRQIYISNKDENIKQNFSIKMLKRLNKRPWKPFDEIKSPIRSFSGRPFIGFELLLVDIDLNTYNPFDRSSYTRQQVLYRFALDTEGYGK
jgi:hypothetical protein